MHHHLLAGILLLLFVAHCASPPPEADDSAPAVSADTTSSRTYDAAKATAYGADDYGMKTYVFAYLKGGPNRDRSPEEAAALQQAHLRNITRLAEAGKLVLAGPFLDGGDIRGLYIFDVPTIAEAEALTQTDPAIQAGQLEMELVQWYGSAALVELNAIHATIAKRGIAE